ncbi:hypothetical protein [Roseiflexus sp.]|nr:hypothetical protein [Roseiflexus sp.]
MNIRTFYRIPPEDWLLTTNADVARFHAQRRVRRRLNDLRRRAPERRR